MLAIRLLGGFQLASESGGLPRQLGHKLQGLIAVLAMSGGQPVLRGRLAGLLWGDRCEDLARHSLSQALTTARRAIEPDGSSLLIAGPDSIGLASGAFWLDVDEFEKAAQSQRPEDLATACRLYRGEFLEGLAVDKPLFEDWLLVERHRLQEQAADVFGRRLESQVVAGTIDAAVETARRLLAITPLDEAAHARLIQLYGLQGRRGLAEAHHARLADLWRREFGEAPGHQVDAALREARRPPGPSPVGCGGAPPVPGPRQRPPHPGRTWTAPLRVIGGSLVLVLLLVAGAWSFHGHSTRDRTNALPAAAWEVASPPSIAVLPFVNLTGEARQDWLVDGITRDIITDLSRFSTLFVISANSSFRYRGRAVKVQEVARDLAVRYVLEGSIGHVDGTLQARVSLIDAMTGRHTWADRIERPAADLFAVQKEISRQVATMIGSERGLLLQAEVERIDRLPTSSLAAYELFQKGVHHRNLETEQDTVRARRLFERAVALDPGYARALANLGLTYLDDIWGDWTDDRLSWLRMAEEVARRATGIDASEPTGYMVLGLVYFLESQHDQAIPLLEKARALNPNDDHTLHALGYVLFYSGASPAEGVALLEEMQRRNPYYPEVILRDLAQGYLYAGRPKDALDALNRVARRHRPSYWIFKAASHVQLDQLGEARAAIEEALKLDPALTLEGEHERRLAMGLEPGQANFLTGLLRQAGLPARGARQSSSR